VLNTVLADAVLRATLIDAISPSM